MSSSLLLKPEGLTGKIRQEEGSAPLPDAVWYVARESGDGLEYRFPAGALAGMSFLTADFLVDCPHLVVFELSLAEGEKGERFTLIYSALNYCSARMRMRLEAVKQNRWRYEREGAWLKPMCGGVRVDLAKVDRMAIKVLRKSEEDARWCMTPVTACVSEPPLLEKLTLPKGPLLDEMGQNAWGAWPGKSKNPDEVTERLKRQRTEAGELAWPSGFSRWGGCRALRFPSTGFFKTHHDGSRWWLADPAGFAFWSAGMDCVRVDTEAACAGLEEALSWVPEREGKFAEAHGRRAGLEHRRRESKQVNFLAANFIRAFGPDDWYGHWGAIALAQLRKMGFNTVANWSDWRLARDAKFPYVRHLGLSYARTPFVYRDFPDVFNPGFEQDAADYAAQLKTTAEDPALIGYFMMNEPTWGFSPELPAAAMLFIGRESATRRELAAFLKARHRSDRGLCGAWRMKTSLAEVASGPWRRRFTPRASKDLEDFSSVMCERHFGVLSRACRAADPNHLNLGIRYFTVPPEWAVSGMRCFDVFSVNCYDRQVAPGLAKIADMLKQPVMVGEWHFGALDAGLPASGIGRVLTQADRGRAFRVYTEGAASLPWCVGVHWFTLYDESVLGRFDGENWNIGFLDVCNRPYDALARAARLSHERLYDVARGLIPPYAEEPYYPPKLFL